MVFADQIQPVISAEYHTGDLKGAAHKFAQARQLVFMTQDKAQLVDKLSRESGKLLGFN